MFDEVSLVTITFVVDVGVFSFFNPIITLLLCTSTVATLTSAPL